MIINELSDWGKDLEPILFDINISLNNIVILKTESFNKFRVNHNDVFLTLFYQQQFILIIQLAKLFSSKDKTHKRNINTLLKELQSEELDENIILAMGSNLDDTFTNRQALLNVIKDIKAELEVFSEDIKSIIYLRDKVCAHTDPDATDKSITIDLLTKLVRVSNKIYYTLFRKILGNSFHPQMANQYTLSSLDELID